MRTTRALAAAGAAVAVLGLAAPAAVADGMGASPSNIVALPSVIARGGQLTVTVDGCFSGGNAMATSPGFERPANLSLVGGSGTTSSGTARISRSASPGSYSITVRCSNGSSLTRDSAYTVIGGVRGGLGGSSSAGATPTDMAIGGGLVAAAVVGGGVFWMRRRTERGI
ncbi:hypothetical protein OG223_46295 [Streptomyces sp. NBC_01478]|jgi:hypothetical protein|uniref:hypothetical protein n=1 Tax=Streptomyces sp. NBC_01478 TaxID=2903882 RepID=UPI002E34C88D|nr:hypothetical protein [Streptomyces sp. NBC_01478]